MSINDVIGEPVEIEREQPEQVQEEAPEQTEQVAEQRDEPPPEQKTVPLPALHEERAKRRELQAQLQAERERVAAMEARFEERMRLLQASVAPKQEAPSLEENPVGHLKHSLDEVRDVAQKTNAQFEAWQQQQIQAQQIQAAASRVTAAEEAFIAQKPDYNEALNYYRAQRARELVAMTGMDEDQARQHVGRELMEGAIHHAASGRNPAAIAYQLAEARGYKPQPRVTDAQKIETQQRGVAAAKTLSSGGTAGGLNARALLDMSDEDFAKATKGNKWRELMGG